MDMPSYDQVSSYYDERVDGKLRDFTHPNPRIEAAVQTIAEWAPSSPRRILEIGCGIGATTWRMARSWPQAKVIGVDISPISIEVANACFRRPNLSYQAGPFTDSVMGRDFDLIVMTDVYEHISPGDRPSLHSAIRALMADEARFILTIPTPATQERARRCNPAALQPVDENITISDMETLAHEVGARLIYYREVGIWHYGDYFHAVLGRFQELPTVALRQPALQGAAAYKQMLKRLLGRAPAKPEGHYDYLGTDLLRPRPAEVAARFQVSVTERRRLASAWAGRTAVLATSVKKT